MPLHPARGLAILSTLLLVACGSQRRADELASRPTDSRVDVFVRAVVPGGATVELDIAALALRDSAGERIQLPLERTTLRSDKALRRLELGGGTVAPASFEALEVVLRGAALVQEGARRPLRLREPDAVGVRDPLEGLTGDAPSAEVTYEVPIAFQLARAQAVSVFLEWNVEGSVIDGSEFVLRLSPSVSRPQVRYSLLYLTDPSSGTVRVVDRRDGEVVATGKVGQEPRAIAASRIGFTMFVANAGDGSVSFVDSRNYHTEITVPVRLGAGTSDIAVVTPGSTLAVCNSSLDTVSLIDIRTSVRFADVPVGRAPVRLVAIPELDRVYTANSGSDDVSVIDVRNAQLVATIPAESAPSCITTDRRGRELYVGHRISANLLTLDARTFTPIDTVFVGNGVTAVLADRRRDRVYVAREMPAELLVVDRRQNAVLRRIRLSAPVINLVQPPEGPLIYGASPRTRGLVTVDVIVGREGDPIPCGAPVNDIAIAE